MITLSVNCSRVSVRRVSHVLQKLQECLSHIEVATAVSLKNERTR
jgi:hypothetical protein